MSESIQHNGIIDKIENNTVYVRIIQQSACSGCHAKSMCSASEEKEKIIEIIDYTGKYQENEKVMICGRSSLGLQAVFLAFVLPLIIVVSAIVVGSGMQWEETTSGLIGLSLLIPYYYILFLLRDKLKRKFIFILKKLN